VVVVSSSVTYFNRELYPETTALNLKICALTTIQYNTIHKIFIQRDYTALSRGANKTWTLKTG